MALVGNMIDEAFAGNPSTVNYAIFVSAFSMFTLFYLVPASFNLDWALHPIIMITIDALNCIFFFCAAIDMAAKLTGNSCGNSVSSFFLFSFHLQDIDTADAYTVIQSFTRHNEIANGSRNPEKRCREAQAVTAFLWFGWAGYMASVIISIFMARSAVTMRGGRAGGAGRRRPNMAQV